MSQSDTPDEMDASSAPLIEHLAELRTRLIRSVLAFIVGIVLAFMVAEPILQFLLTPIEETLRNLGDPSPTLQYTSPQEYLFTLFRISMVFGFALAFPVIAFQMWRFVAPGLYKNEQGAFLPFIYRFAFDVYAWCILCTVCCDAAGDAVLSWLCRCELDLCQLAVPHC